MIKIREELRAAMAEGVYDYDSEEHPEGLTLEDFLPYQEMPWMQKLHKKEDQPCR